ncbi:hypothetical protein L596_018577 [Steinernema carpocapsae]|uniref:Uncharacterized protein n=1 Tax=Steinernema carpocapsae TaxID=34508 RepID=A0A4U5N522_STECR|nr:hypothetical protein L596_018577 [Steinernema carpocapsae]
MSRVPVVADRSSKKPVRSQHDLALPTARMCPRIAAFPTPSALLFSAAVVLLALQPVAEALTLSDLCRQDDSLALCQFQEIPQTSETMILNVPKQMRLRRSGGGQSRVRQDEIVKPGGSENPAKLRLAFWRYTRLHPRDDRFAVSSISKNGGKRGYDFIRFGRSPTANRAPLASYDFIRLGRK